MATPNSLVTRHLPFPPIGNPTRGYGGFADTVLVNRGQLRKNVCGFPHSLNNVVVLLFFEVCCIRGKSDDLHRRNLWKLYLHMHAAGFRISDT